MTFTLRYESFPHRIDTCIVRWLPIMKAYEAGTPAYFATPPVNLIRAYHTSLTQILKSGVSLQERFKLHREAAQRIRDAAVALGLKLVPVDPYYTANGLSAVSSHLVFKVFH